MRGYDGFTLGDATQQTLREIWNGARYQAFRRALLSDDAAAGLRRLRAALEPVSGRGIRVAVVIPTLDEEAAIGRRARRDPARVPSTRSSSPTAAAATAPSSGRVPRAPGSSIESRRGYGRACLAGAGARRDGCEIIVFLDGDGSDCAGADPGACRADPRRRTAISSSARVPAGVREPGSMSAHQVLAGYRIGAAMRLLYGVRYTDMGAVPRDPRDALVRSACAR